MALLLVLSGGCTPRTAGDREPATTPPGGRKLHLCGAIRGNGAKVFSTIAAMASFTENYGTFDALSGASSGGIADFIYESVLMSPVLRDCGGPCTDEVIRKRAGLMLKAFQGYIDYVGGKDSPEASPIWVVQAFVKKLNEKKVDLMLVTDSIQAFLAIHDILKNPTIRSLANKDILNFVDGVDLKQLRSLRRQKEFVEAIRVKVGRIVATAREGLKLERSDPELLVRTGLPNMPEIMRLIGRIGDFYVGRGPAMNKAGWLAWLNSCTGPATFRKPWVEIRPTACGKQFDRLVRQFHVFFERGATPNYRSRASDPIGTFIPILNATSMVVGKENVDLWKEKKQKYEAGKQPTEWKFLPVNFARDFKIGYWGNPQDLETIERNIKSWGDYKSSLFYPLGQLDWFEVMSRSASEPGLNHALPYEDEHGSPLPLRNGERALTTGGWTDGHSVLVLRSLGCERVVYVTRRGEDSGFAKGVAESLGMTPEDRNRLFGVRLDVTEPLTSHELSLLQASGTWCTNWNKVPVNPDLLEKDGHSADFQTNAEAGENGYRFFEDRRVFPDPWPRASAHTGLRGCEVRTPARK